MRLAEGGSAPAGTGLGLSVVRQLVAELGGQWWVGDVPGRGARFRVELPLAAPAPGVAERVGGTRDVVASAATNVLGDRALSARG